MIQPINKAQFALFTLLQSFSQDGELPDFIDDTKELEEYILRKFREIYHNANVKTEDGILKIQLTPPSGIEAAPLEEDSDKIYSYFKVGFDAESLSRAEKVLAQEARSLEDIAGLNESLLKALLALIDLAAVPICQRGDRNCQNRARLSNILKSIRELQQIQ